MKGGWRLRDMIDLEYLLHLDASRMKPSEQRALRSRDRDLYLEHIAPEVSGGDDQSTRFLVRKWLEVRRLQVAEDTAGDATRLPGAFFQELLRLVNGIFFLGGILIGCGMAVSFLTYSGTAPLNVSSFFAFFVVLQLILIVLLGFLFLFRHLKGQELGCGVIYGLVRRGLARAILSAHRRLQKKISGQERLDLAAVIGKLKTKKEIGIHFAWSTFTLVQLGGIGFNLGVLATTLVKVSVADMAFGWQSTLQLREELVADLARWIAMPWSWFVPQQFAYPLPQQVAGSKMVLKDGIYHLATQDLVSWWPFLCLAIFTYGLLPRLFLFVFGLGVQRRKLEQLKCDTAEIRGLVQRMVTPLVSTTAGAAGATGTVDVPSQDGVPERAGFQNESKDIPVDSKAAHGIVGLLIPDELFDDCPYEILQGHLSRFVGSNRLLPLRYGQEDSSSPGEVIGLLKQAGAGWGTELLILHEAWQPPIEEMFSLLRELRQAIGERVALTVVLIGKPKPATILTPVTEVHMQVWTAKIQGLADPYLDVTALIQQ